MKKIHWQKSMAVTLVLIILMAAASVIVVRNINTYEEEKCFDRLDDETEELIQNIEANFERDTENLELMARAISEYHEELPARDLWSMLDSYSATGMLSGIELLLPDNSVLTEDGQSVNAEGRLSFEEEAALGAHISGRETDLRDEEKMILRNCVPVVQNGETKAILCGIIDLEQLPEKMQTHPYGGEAAFYLIDGATGDFLIDTWHKRLGNTQELGSRTMASGYQYEQLTRDLPGGKPGYVAFVSETVGEYLYFYYAPVGINQWRAALSVPETLVFSSANEIKNILNIFIGFESLCFVVYFLWMLRISRQAADEKQRQLDTVSYIYDVEKLLFNAHEKRENMEKALEKIGYIISAETVGFFMEEQIGSSASFIWSQKEETENKIFRDIFKDLRKYFEKGGRSFDASTPEEMSAALHKADLRGIKNIIAVAIEAKDGTVGGVLAGFNIAGRHISSADLKIVSFSFEMFCDNIWSYNAIKEKGEKDVLSGLYNRNRYETDLHSFPDMFKKSLACIYIDVNGLHELNNSSGHDAGDKMLRTVSEQILEKFGEQYAYRIGGDEFVIFAMDMEEDEVTRKTRDIEKNLEEKKIYVSVGVHWESGEFLIDMLIKAAEKKMYSAKREFYSKETNDRRMRT